MEYISTIRSRLNSRSGLNSVESNNLPVRQRKPFDDFERLRMIEHISSDTIGFRGY